MPESSSIDLTRPQPGTLATLEVAGPAPSPAARNIESHVVGSFNGQLANGQNIVQLNDSAGAIVNLYQGKPIEPRRVPAPVLLRPRPFPGLLGREMELAAGRDAIRAAQPLEYYASAGWGKTVLLRSLGQVAADGCPDGVVYLPADGEPLPDLLQFCFDTFYETDAPIPFKPTEGELRRYLHPVRALLMIDDLSLDREHVEALLQWLPNSVVVIATKDRTLWASGQAVKVGGLSRDAAIQLVESELGRLLTTAEQPTFDQLWSSLEGNPLSLIQAAAAVRARPQALTSITAGDPRQLLGSLDDDEHKVLGVLASLYDAAVPASHAAAITGVTDSPAILLRLTQAGLTELKEGGYRLSREPAAALIDATGPQQWTAPSIRHFATWAQRFAGDVRLILEVSGLLMKVTELATDTQRWREAWQLVRAVERSLALSGRWGAWHRLLDYGMQAAQALEDRAAQAWVLHQLGTRALCLGDVAVAGTFLNQALEIRRALGDSEGIAASSHNLQRLAPPPTPPSPPAPHPPIRWLRWVTRIGAALGLVVAAGFVFPQPGAGSFWGQAFFPSGILSLEASQPLSFDAVPVGLTSSSRVVTVHNTGSGTLRLTGLSTEPPFQQTSNCPIPVQLRPNDTCTILVTYHPGAAGSASGILAVTADGKSYTAVLSGSGIYIWRLESLPIAFGKVTVGRPIRKELRLTNTSGAPLPLSSIRMKDLSKSFSVASGGCLPASPIAPGAACPIVLSFVPGSLGSFTDSLLVADTTGDQREYSVTGQGVLPQVVLSRTFVDWTKDPSTPNPAPITVTNTGEGVLLISSAMLTKDSSPAFRIVKDTDGCSNQQLMPQGQCTLQVEHVQIYRILANDLNGALQFTDNASDSPQSVGLHAVG
ncbi:MAG TPA: choice-of-anchor D domain-containing protein [Candidatus Nitrosopolaris sp.]|nr:choice-of-anchor D domain-containing protein [Candidatus Nitrosopolaris sp.]